MDLAMSPPEPDDDDLLISGEIDQRLYELMVDVTGPSAWSYADVAEAIGEWLRQHDADDITTEPVLPL